MHPLTCHSHADISPGVKLPDSFAGQDEKPEENALSQAERRARQMAAINRCSFIFRRRRVERKVIRLEFGVHLQRRGGRSGSVGFLSLFNFTSKQFCKMPSMLAENEFSFRDLICIGIKSAKDAVSLRGE